MPRNISFSLTTEQIRNQTKTVTRRLGWWEYKNGRRPLKVGDVLNGCVKCMGLKPGEKIERLGQIRITSIRRECLARLWAKHEGYGDWEARREGFPELTGAEFGKLFCDHMRVLPSEEVTRIEFEYLERDQGGRRCNLS